MKRIYLFSLLLSVALLSKATDLVVEEFGITPSYSSIASAVTAANDGDRIIIRNKSGNIPWIEDINVNKSLEFLSFQNDTFFIVQGNYTITPAIGRTISFVGMKNLSGGISTVTNSPAGTRCKVNVVNCYFTSGNITLTYNYFDLQVISSKLSNGYVAMCHGKVIGSEITTSSYNCITIGQESANAGDVTQIIGNKLYCTSTSYSGMYLVSTSLFYQVSNNYIRHVNIGIYLSSVYNSSSQINQFYNNTIDTYSYSNSENGIYISYTSAANAITELMNNVIDEQTASTSAYGIFVSTFTGQLNLYYNHIDNSHYGPIAGAAPTSSLNNTVNTTFSLGVDGRLLAGASGIDGGNPSPLFYDLDLTVGDAGAYGGSFTLDNYFPAFAGSARVYNMRFPKSIRQGTTLSIEADGFDR